MYSHILYYMHFDFDMTLIIITNYIHRYCFAPRIGIILSKLLVLHCYTWECHLRAIQGEFFLFAKHVSEEHPRCLQGTRDHANNLRCARMRSTLPRRIIHIRVAWSLNCNFYFDILSCFFCCWFCTLITCSSIYQNNWICLAVLYLS